MTYIVDSESTQNLYCLDLTDVSQLAPDIEEIHWIVITLGLRKWMCEVG